jgi:predicted PurR-regulated permease PerM
MTGRITDPYDEGVSALPAADKHHPGIPSPAWWRPALLTLLVIAVTAIGYFVFQQFLRTAAMILLLAAILTYILSPLVEGMVRACRGRYAHPVRIVSVLLIYGLLAGLLVTFGALVTQTFSAQARELQAAWGSADRHVPAQFEHLVHWYRQTLPAGTRAVLEARIQQELRDIPGKYLPHLANSLLGLAKTAGMWMSMLIEFIFVPLVAFYFLTDAAKVREQVLFFFPQRHRQGMMTYGQEIDHILRHYVQGQLVLCAIAWIVVTLAMLLLNVPGALLLGVIAGATRAIPVLGPVVGGIPVLTVVLFNASGPAVFWWVLIGFTLLHLFESKILMPRILGDHLDMHPVLVVLSLLVGYEMLGLLGMFLAPPLVAILRAVLRVRRGASEGLAPVAVGAETV